MFRYAREISTHAGDVHPLSVLVATTVVAGFVDIAVPDSTFRPRSPCGPRFSEASRRRVREESVMRGLTSAISSASRRRDRPRHSCRITKVVRGARLKRAPYGVGRPVEGVRIHRSVHRTTRSSTHYDIRRAVRFFTDDRLIEATTLPIGLPAQRTAGVLAMVSSGVSRSVALSLDTHVSVSRNHRISFPVQPKVPR